MEETMNNYPGTGGEDRKRFKKESKNKNLQKLVCEISNDVINCKFLERGNAYDVYRIELVFIDSGGNRRVLRKDDSSFSEIKTLFSDWEKILISYRLKSEDTIKYCSWGYKKHSATTEKLFAYFKTQVCSYLVYVDAQHPEHFFLFSDYGDSIENLYNFLKSIIKEN